MKGEEEISAPTQSNARSSPLHTAAPKPVTHSPVKPKQATSTISPQPKTTIVVQQRKTNSAPSSPRHYAFPTSPNSNTSQKQIQPQKAAPKSLPLVPNIDNPTDGSSTTENSSIALAGTSTGGGNGDNADPMMLGLEALERQAEEFERRKVKQNSCSSLVATPPRAATRKGVRRANPFDASPLSLPEHGHQNPNKRVKGNRDHAQDQGDVPATVHVEDEDQSISTINRDTAVVAAGGDGKGKIMNRVDSFGKFLRTPIKHTASLTRSIGNKVKKKPNSTNEAQAASKNNSKNNEFNAFDPNTPLLAGYLHKRGRHGKWQKRWFETDGNSLQYFKNEEREKLLATLDIVMVGGISHDKTDPSRQTFIIEVAGRDYYLRADSDAIANDWVRHLNLVKEARMEVGNLKLVHPGSSYPNATGEKRGSADENHAPRVVMMASRQRTKGFGHDEFNQMENMIEQKPETDDVNTTGFTSTLSPVSPSVSSSNSLARVSQSKIPPTLKKTGSSLVRWNKQRSPFQNITRRLSRWAKRMTMLRCVIKDDVVHGPGPSESTVDTAPTGSKQHQDRDGGSGRRRGSSSAIDTDNSHFYELNPDLLEGHVSGGTLKQISEGDQTLLQDNSAEDIVFTSLDQKPKAHTKPQKRGARDSTIHDPSSTHEPEDNSSGRNSPISISEGSGVV